MSTFGQYVRNLRKSKGLGLREAANTLEISSAYLARVEGDQDKPPALEVLRRMAMLYGVDSDEIIKRSKLRVLDEVRERVAAGPELLALFRAVRNLNPETVRQVIRDAIAKGSEARGAQKASDAEIERAADDLVEEMRRLSQQELYRNGLAGIFGADIRPPHLTRARIEQFAHKVLEQHGITTASFTLPIPVDRIAELTDGVDVVWRSSLKCMDVGQSNVMGLSRWSERGEGRWVKEIHLNPALIDSETSVSQHRLNFTLGHELFHCLKHLPLMFKEKGIRNSLLRQGTSLIHTCYGGEIDAWRQGKSSSRKLRTSEDWREWQANEFASHLLMPRWAIAKTLRSMGPQVHLAAAGATSGNDACYVLAAQPTADGRSLNETFGVSRTAMAFQLAKFNTFGQAEQAATP
jgi:transcriptional regulator with XRE-family HTH domain/Zn-dependent peptidase ImmA (M78 family)